MNSHTASYEYVQGRATASKNFVCIHILVNVSLVPSLDIVAAWGTAEYGDPATFPADMDPILNALTNATHE
jgi:hypothetical protein